MYILYFWIAIEREEAKVKKSLKDAAKQGHKEVCTTLAKEIVRSRKAKNRIYTSKAQINSVSMQMKNQQGTVRMSISTLFFGDIACSCY